MLKQLRWLFGLLLPCASLAQTAPSFQLSGVLGTPLFSPTDVAVDGQGFMYVLEDDPYFSPRRGYVHKLDPQGRFVARLDITKPNYSRPLNVCEGSALALDAAGNLYVADHGAGEVRKFSPGGQLLRTFTDSRWVQCSIYNPNDLAVDAAGNVLVLDNLRLQKFNAQGVLQWEYAPPVTFTPGVPEVRLWSVVADAAGNAYFLNSNYTITKVSAAGQVLQTIALGALGFSSATLALDADGNFYVALGGGSPVYKFDPTGKQRLALLGPDISSGTLNLAFDGAGKLYACSSGNRGLGATIYKFEPTGPEITRWGGSEEGLFMVHNAAGEYFVYDFIQQQIRKYAADGRELLRFGGRGYGDGKFEANNGSGEVVTGLAVDAHGNVYAAGNPRSSSQLQKFDGQGRFLQVITSPDLNRASPRITSLAVDPADNMYLADATSNQVLKFDPRGQLLLRLGPGGASQGQFNKPVGVAIDGLGFVYVADSAGVQVRKFTPTGQLVRRTVLRQRVVDYSYAINPVSLSVDQAGTLAVSHASWDSVRVVDRTGRFQQGIANYLGPVQAVSLAPDGTRLLALSPTPAVVSAFANGAVPARHQSRLQGHIFQDLNQDCGAQADEPNLAGLLVVAEPGEYYGTSDPAGRYTILADTGTYTVRQLLPQEPGRLVQQTCAAGPTVVRVASPDATLAGPDFGNQVSPLPFLRVAIAANRRRRCFRNLTTVTYSNTGYAAAASAVVTVAMPPEVVLVSANAPYTRDRSGNYRFAVGTLQPYQQGTILIQDSVTCGDPAVRGRTVCTRAWITPPNYYPPPPTGEEASVQVQGKALASNQVRFVVRNATALPMRDSLGLRVYQNGVLALQHRYRLAAGDSLVLRVPATQPVVRLEADQPASHPTQRLASSTVEVRALSAAGQINAAMLAPPPDAAGPEAAEDCQPIRDSYDPNDKLVVPAGATAQHYTPTGVPLRYQVRFQNTGNDEAYRVQVVDTLAADLDLRTLHVTGASHPYQLQVSGRGRPVLTFTFASINLPPSTRDAVGSNGFVQFSIQPKAGLPAKALIENAADIFFDFNPPVRTNATTNRLYDQPLVVEPAVALAYADVLASPTVQQVVPAQGRAGTLVTLSGQRFGASPAANVVRFNGVAAPVLSASATTLTVRVPAAATSGSVQVATGEGTGRSAQPFTIYQPPTLATIAPAEGVPGSVITLTGSQFAPAAAQDTVWMGGVPALVQQASATALQVVVPAGAPTGPVRVATLGGQVESAQPFVVWYPPTLSGFSPGRGKAGDVITLAGSNFALAGRSTVTLGVAPAAVLQATATSLQVRVPAGAQPGPLPVQVQTPGGAARAASLFTFWPAPSISSFAPAQASVGETVTLTGQHFLVDGQPDTVYVGGMRAPVLAASATSITIRVPSGAQSGPLTVGGVGGRGQSAAFTVQALAPAEAIAVYPNPARGAVTLDWLRADFALEQVQVYNALGQCVASLDLRQRAATSLTIPFAGQTGLFVLVVHTSQGPVLKRLTLY